MDHLLSQHNHGRDDTKVLKLSHNKIHVSTIKSSSLLAETFLMVRLTHLPVCLLAVFYVNKDTPK